MNAPRIHTIRVPNPFVEGRNRVYVIESDPITMIDSGVATEKGHRELLVGLQQANVEPGAIKRIVLTHKHIDHIGNAWRFQRDFGCDIYIHASERKSVEDVDPSGSRYANVVASRLDEWEVPDDARPSSQATSAPTWEIESARAQPLSAGQLLPLGGDAALEVIHTPGHTAGSICLKLGSLLFSGDHVLPDVSPNVGGGDLRSRGLLSQFLESLTRIQQLAPHVRETLPGHGDPMHDVATRCAELIGHHDQRLEQVVGILAADGEQSVYRIARQLFGEMKSFHVVLGCAEALAHLEVLEANQRVESHDGRYRLL